MEFVIRFLPLLVLLSLIVLPIYFYKKEKKVIYNEKPNASFWKYIGVWIIWYILTAISGVLLGILYAFIPEPNSIKLLYFQDSILYITIYLVSTVMFILTYVRFKDIKIRKIMPYLWVFGLIGVGSIYQDTKVQYSEYGIDAGPLALVLIISYIVSNLTIRYYFRNSPYWDTTHTSYTK